MVSVGNHFEPKKKGWYFLADVDFGTAECAGNGWIAADFVHLTSFVICFWSMWIWWCCLTNVSHPIIYPMCIYIYTHAHYIHIYIHTYLYIPIIMYICIHIFPLYSHYIPINVWHYLMFVIPPAHRCHPPAAGESQRLPILKPLTARAWSRAWNMLRFLGYPIR